MSTTKSGTQSAADRRTAETELKRLVAKFSPDAASLVATVRRWLRKRLPAAHELVYEYRDCFVVSVSPTDRGYEGAFALRGAADGVRLYFNAGKALKDPLKLLRGPGTKARYLELEGPSTLSRDGVDALFDQAVARTIVPFARTGRGPVIIQSVKTGPNAKKRKAK